MFCIHRNEDMKRFITNVIFTYTYKDAFATDRSYDTCPPDLLQAIKCLFESPNMQAIVNKLKSLFLTKKECLIHGDLHDGSYMLYEGVAKVSD